MRRGNRYGSTFRSNQNAPTALAAPQRNPYFYGKLLDADHLQLEQEYLNSKRWLVNLLLQGMGVVAGLAVPVGGAVLAGAVAIGVAVLVSWAPADAQRTVRTNPCRERQTSS